METEVVDNYVALKRLRDKENAGYWEIVVKEDVRLKKSRTLFSFYEGIEIDSSLISNTEIVYLMRQISTGDICAP